MRIDRTALYEQVWQEPLKTLASKFGVSDVRLAVDTPANLRIDPRRGNFEKADAKSKMRLVIRSGWDGGERLAWEDTNTSKIEDHLSEILIKMGAICNRLNDSWTQPGEPE